MKEEKNKLIAKNTLLLYFRMLLTLGISLYTSRIILTTLGIEDFGIYNIIGGIVTLFSFINGALVSSTQRFLSFEIGRNDIVAQKTTFSASLTIYIIFCVIIFFLGESVGLWVLNNYLNIPPERLSAANWVFQFTLLTFCLNLLRVPYNACVVAFEKMSFYAYLSIVEVVLKLIILYPLQKSSFDTLITYSLLTSGISFVILLFYWLYCLKYFNICNFKAIFSLKKLAPILKFSSWSLLGSLANLSVGQGINIIFNLSYGVSLNASLGLNNQVKNAINSFLSNFQMAFSPQMIKSYASNDTDRFHLLIVYTSKYSFFLTSIVTVPFLINSEFVITHWLTTVPPYLVAFCQLSVFNLLLDSLSAPLGIAIQATGNLKKYQITYSILSFLALPISILLTYLKSSPVDIISVGVLVNFIVFLWKVIFVSKQVELSLTRYIKEVIFRIITIVLAIILMLYFAHRLFVIDEWSSVIISSLFSVAVSVFLVFIVGINQTERNHILTFLKKYRVSNSLT